MFDEWFKTTTLLYVFEKIKSGCMTNATPIIVVRQRNAFKRVIFCLKKKKLVTMCRQTSISISITCEADVFRV